MIHLIVILFDDETIVHVFQTHNTRDQLLELFKRGWIMSGGDSADEPFLSTDICVPMDTTHKSISTTLMLFTGLILRSRRLTICFNDGLL
jgi:hypothetical protein